MSTFQRYPRSSVPDDYYVTNTFREHVTAVLTDLDGKTLDDDAIAELIAKAVFNLETDYRIRLKRLEACVAAAGVSLPPAS